MRRLVLTITTGLLLLVAGPVAAREVAVSDLVSDGARHAGVEVTVVGELIGDYGDRRNGWTWTQLNGDAYAMSPVADGGPLHGSNVGIGVRLPSEMAADLDPPGRYRTVGPIVELTGVWKYHDPDRQGETYLEVASIVVVAPGRSLDEPAEPWMYAVAAILAVLASIVWRSYIIKRDATE